MSTSERRYDIDWVRVIAIGLLLVYHVAIGFQRWGVMIGFIANDKSWDGLWTPMTMLNVWRIPLLFFVSGMGAYFAIQNRNWKQLLGERAGRILVPFIVGVFGIVPLHMCLWQYNYHFPLSYAPNPGHLWFLANIFIYVLVCAPLFFYIKKHERGLLANGIRNVITHPLGLLPVIALFIIEALILDPRPYELYAMTMHGFILGLIAFLTGFCFVLGGTAFWTMMKNRRWMFLGVAALLFVLRLRVFHSNAPQFLLVIESQCWIYSVFAWSYQYLNRPGKVLSYLSQAAYPVYILHMVFLYLGSLLIFPLNLPSPAQFILVLLFTATGCFAVYEGIIRRVSFLRPLFGLKWNVQFQHRCDGRGKGLNVNKTPGTVVQDVPAPVL